MLRQVCKEGKPEGRDAIETGTRKTDKRSEPTSRTGIKIKNTSEF
jgi:hypothetical protein